MEKTPMGHAFGHWASFRSRRSQGPWPGRSEGREEWRGIALEGGAEGARALVVEVAAVFEGRIGQLHVGIVVEVEVGVSALDLVEECGDLVEVVRASNQSVQVHPLPQKARKPANT